MFNSIPDFTVKIRGFKVCPTVKSLDFFPSKLWSCLLWRRCRRKKRWWYSLHFLLWFRRLNSMWWSWDWTFRRIMTQYRIWRIFASWHSQLSRNLPPKITVLFTTCTVPTVNFQQSEWAPILVFFSGKLKQASKVTFIIRCDSISGHELVSHQSIFTKSVKVRFVFLCHCQTKLASNPSALPQRRVKSTQSEVDANLKSHFYTSATNQLKLIFGQGCQTKSASNPSVLP